MTAAIGPSSQEASQAELEPVTMAVATAVGVSRSHASRWTAVSVSLAPEDAAISLEQEMQKAYAAFAAAENGHSSAITADSVSSSHEAAMPDALLSVPATVAPEAVQTLSAVASAATDAVTAAVKELENVASAYAAQAPAGVGALVTVVENLAAASEVLAQPAVVNTEAIAASPVQPSVPAVSSSAAEICGPPDTAAMAAAVGGKIIEDLSGSDSDPAIASIVDSVLANLRPRIVEEISRKLGKK